MAPTSLWSTARYSGKEKDLSSADLRTDFEKDHDRLLFSAPFRRLADKTQVFPLERNDSVRTRLTHSLEVANLAKSIGNRLLRKQPDIFGADDDTKAAVPVILSTVGLAHDLGNPPFGHQGESAIARWFASNDKLLTPTEEPVNPYNSVNNEERNDFLNFEGNAQALRLVAKLQGSAGTNGLDFTAATLAALMKYTVPSNKTEKDKAARKKHGFFASEARLVEWIREQTGLKEGQRHPLTWIMEAADDTAYLVLDIEDAIKKRLVSPEDLLAFLKKELSTSHDKLIDELSADFKKADGSTGKGLGIVREIKTGYLRTRLIAHLVGGAANRFEEDANSYTSGKGELSLLSQTDTKNLCEALKSFAVEHAYRDAAVLRVELTGTRVIHELMSAMWDAISSRSDQKTPASRRTTPKASYVYALISDSYRKHFEKAATEEPTRTRYFELQLLSDMIAGMTDGYAIDLHSQLLLNTANGA